MGDLYYIVDPTGEKERPTYDLDLFSTASFQLKFTLMLAL